MKIDPSAVSFDGMLQGGYVRSYMTYEKINNYSCVSQYLIYINESISEISVMKHSLFNYQYAQYS